MVAAMSIAKKKFNIYFFIGKNATIAAYLTLSLMCVRKDWLVDNSLL